MKSIKNVLSKSGLYDGKLVVYEFEQDGPSKSGRIVISLVICPTATGGPSVTVVSDLHKNPDSLDLQDWNELVDSFVRKASRSSSEDIRKDAKDMIEINKTITRLLVDYTHGLIHD